MFHIDEKQEDILKKIEALQAQYAKLDEEKKKLKEQALPLLGAALVQEAAKDPDLQKYMESLVGAAMKKTRNKQMKEALQSLLVKEDASENPSTSKENKNDSSEDVVDVVDGEEPNLTDGDDGEDLE